MNTLLIYPQFPDTFWGLKNAIKFINKKAAYPPLGLLTIASMLPDKWAKRLVDINITKLTDELVRWADIAFISAMTLQKKSADHVISVCKNADVKIVAGGPLFTSECRKYLDTVDHVILGEAEVALPQFLYDLEHGFPKKIYKSDRFCNLEDSPIPLWNLLNMNDYASMSVQVSRGCPFNCEFCNVTALFGHKPRIKSVKQVINELDAIYDNGWRGRIFFVDDNFIGNKRYVKRELLPAIIKWRENKKGIVFNTQASINLADDQELINMMVRAGFDSVFIGIETPEEDSLRECNKGQNRSRDLIDDIRRIQNAGLEVQAGFIVGFDHDTPSIFQRQVEFIQKSGIVTAMVGILQAPIGTRLYNRLKREGRILGHMTGDNVDGTTNIIPRMGIEILNKGYKYIMSNIYSAEGFCKRVKRFLQEYHPPKIYERINKDRICALIKANIKLGIIDKERKHYWKTLGWTLFHKPRLIPYAVAFAIYGYHFRQVCRNRLGIKV